MEAPRVPSSSELRFRVRLSTRWSDEDNHQVLNNAVYLTLIEETRYRYFAAALTHNRFPFVLAHANVAYLASGRGGEEIEVECATTHVGTTSFTQAYRLRSVARGIVLCEAEARLVCYDPASGEKRPIVPELRAAIEARERHPGGGSSAAV